MEDPEIALQPFGRTLLEEMSRVAHRIQNAVSWRITVRSGKLQGPQPPWLALDGNSLGAAAAIGFMLLDRGKPYDASCLVTAAVGEGDSLETVEEEERKLEAAVEAPGISRVGVAGTSKIETEVYKERGLEVRKLNDLKDAIEFASGSAAGLRDYFQYLMELPDLGVNRPGYIGDRKPTALYVEPDVLKRERRPKSESLESILKAGMGAEWEHRKQQHQPTLPLEVLEIGEESIYGEHLEEDERRVAWKAECAGMGHGQNRCAVVLGPPGQGKTQLALMTAQELAREGWEALATQATGVDQVTLPIVLSFRELTRGEISGERTPETALRQRLASHLKGIGCPPTAIEYVVSHAHEERTWLFLDALDELLEEAQTTFKQFEDVLRQWQCRVVITSRPYAYRRWRFEFPVVEYRLAPLSESQVQALMDTWYGVVPQQANRIHQLAQRSVSVQQMSQNPLLLTLLCWVMERHKVSIYMTRTEIYDSVVRDLLGMAKGVYTVDGRRATELLPLVSEVALAIFEESAGKRAIPHGHLIDLVKSSSQRPRVQKLRVEEQKDLTLVEKADYLVDELLDKRILVSLNPERTAYAFPHRSIAEYLAACALVGKPGPGEFWQFVDAKAWDPDWEQVVLFLAGQLSCSADMLRQLLELLSDNTKDDLFRHRLAVAARCLGEIPSDQHVEVSAEIDRVTEACFAHWSDYSDWYTKGGLRHLSGALPALGRVNGRVGEVPLLNWLSQMLRAGTSHVLVSTAAAVGCMGESAARPEILAPLAELLQHDGVGVRIAAVEAIGRLMPAAATPEILTRLVEFLGNEHIDVRKAAVLAVGHCGAEALKPEILTRLAELLEDQRHFVRGDVARAVGRLGAAAATPEILTRLAEFLYDEDYFPRMCAAEAIGRLGEAAVTPEILTRLVDLQSDKSKDVIREVSEALERLGTAPVSPEIQAHLLELLRSVDGDVRKRATWAVASVGPAAVTPEILTQLTELLGDPYYQVRGFAWLPLCKLSGEALGPEMIARLDRLLDNDDADEEGPPVLGIVLSAVPSLDPKIVTPKLLSQLVELLQHREPWIRQNSTSALVWLAVTPEVLDRLTDVLRDENQKVRCEAVRTFAISPKKVTPKVEAQLEELLCDEDRMVRAYSAGALGQLPTTSRQVASRLEDLIKKDVLAFAVYSKVLSSHAILTPEAVTRLMDHIKRDEDQNYTRHNAAEALVALVANGVRIFRGPNATWQARSVLELSRRSPGASPGTPD